MGIYINRLRFRTAAALFLVFGSGVSSLSAEEQTPTEPTATVAVTLADIESDEGLIVVSVYSGSDGWLSEEGKVLEQRWPVRGQVVDGQFALELELPVGEYGLACYHDLNSNGKMDTNFIGIPKEPAVMSNNAPARFGPPKYKDAKFQLPEEGTQQALKF